MTNPPLTGRLLGIQTVSKPGAPVEPQTEIAVAVDTGLAGDCRGKSRRRKVTVVSRESWAAACADLGAQLSWTLRRANLFIEGPDLKEKTGARLSIGEVVLEITGETTPCSLMDEQHQGLRAALEPDWRGGVTSIVLEPGTIRVGDDIRLEEAPAP